MASLAACSTSASVPEDAPPTCSSDPGVDTYLAGLEKVGVNGMLDFQLVSADPAPPMRDDNTWIVQIDSISDGVVGGPAIGLTLVVSPFMPSHQHGSPIEVIVTPSTSVAGQYTLSPINLWLPGVWQTTIAATEGAVSDRAVYTFCIVP